MAANNILMLRRREEMRAEKALQTAFQVILEELLSDFDISKRFRNQFS